MDTTTKRPSPARARLIDAATRLFYEQGIHAVGVDRVIEEAGVTRATLYKQFGGKENLVLAYLGHEDEMLRAMFTEAGATVSDPDALLDAVVQGIAADIREHHTRGCPFINAAAEYPDAGGPCGSSSTSTGSGSARRCSRSPRRPISSVPRRSQPPSCCCAMPRSSADISTAKAVSARRSSARPGRDRRAPGSLTTPESVTEWPKWCDTPSNCPKPAK